MQRVEVAIAVIASGKRVLICQRKAQSVLGGFWEFPGGKREAGETLAQCAVREVREELCIEVEIVEELAAIEHEYAHGWVRLYPFWCRHVGGEPAAVGCERFAWIEARELGQYRFPEANDPLLREIAARLNVGQ